MSARLTRTEQVERWRRDNPDHARALDLHTHLRRKYGLSVVRYLCTLHQQGNRCARCRSPKWGGPRIKRPAIDHDHETGTFRGLLCLWCNQMLGHLGDNLLAFRDAMNGYAGYLEGRL